MLRVKIAVTIGPSSSDLEKIKEFIKLGVFAFRINFSHGDAEEWKKYVDLVKDASTSLDSHVALIGDLPGPSIRIGEIPGKIVLNRDEEAKIIYAEKVGDVEDRIIPMPLSLFFKNVKVGDVLIMDDGKIQMMVRDVGDREIVVKALTNAEISSRKAVVIKGKDIGLPTFSKRDIEALRFSVKNDFDYIGLSYVRNIGDVELLKSTLASIGGREIGVISKIETVQAINNLS
ncbi:MAG: pyruvate kinase, partial [Nitrososphaerota archaeon]